MYAMHDGRNDVKESLCVIPVQKGTGRVGVGSVFFCRENPGQNGPFKRLLGLQLIPDKQKHVMNRCL